jgi:hypothetical protein
VVSKIKQDAMNGNADVFKWWTLMATDIITQIAFGGDPQMVQLGKVRMFVDIIDEALLIPGNAENKGRRGPGRCDKTGRSEG